MISTVVYNVPPHLLHALFTGISKCCCQVQCEECYKALEVCYASIMIQK